MINLVAGDGFAVSDVVMDDPRLSGIHFTGSTATFQHLWQRVGANIGRYHSYPRLVGETGGKDFVVAHASARPDVLCTALIRGAFDYQGQKCSAASRAFIPHSVWQRMGDTFLGATAALRYGDITDLTSYGGALIDRPAFIKNVDAIERGKRRARRHDRGGRRIRTTALAISCDRPAPLSDATVPTSPSRPSTSARCSRRTFPDDQYERILDVIDYWFPLRTDRRGHRRRPEARATAQDRLRFAAWELLRQRQADRRGGWTLSRLAARADRAPTTRPDRS